MAPSIAPEQASESIPTPTAPAGTTSPFSLGGRTTVITGGGRGLGIVFASAILEAGGDVVCLDLLAEPNPVEWTALQKLAASSGLLATYTRCDITDEEETSQVLDEVAAKALQRNMPLRGLISSAGIQQMEPALEYPVEMFEKMMNVK